MNIFSDFRKDAARSMDTTGGYEWWYFDAVSADDQFSFVIIFYRGNPFSRRYISQLNSDSVNARPSKFPAISISVYEDGDPIYYSFTEFEASDCSFDEERPFVEVGPHRMEIQNTSGLLKYHLTLEETLASGDQIEASLTFKSSLPVDSLFKNCDERSGEHLWNLVQPRAEVEGSFHITGPTVEAREIGFKGRGYHDHNTGYEPMHNEFEDWYWGRFHFSHATLVYYLMNRESDKQHRAWLIDNNNGKVLNELDNVRLEDEGRTLFGLRTAHRIWLHSDRVSVQIQQGRLLDNGPFYQRFMSDAFLQIVDQDYIESQRGISEYICPQRIYNRFFWPFVNMRIRYMAENPHWVQQFPGLYRWTW
ncbi:hydroxyneurosporene synthase [Fodinibius salinus]|uniref:Hydroxyneurosporene synthase n=1 Tax=Fodinibius salinus TaxID=860790 RepID=A0A5D3YNP2_9BACT|nr:hypothetical protein [Fodinibius salinus]TYP95494.1 hydroxyneurosporene synthase [Fodinibius salinus]